ncbi:MAG: GNAT family N-acetyltransferase [Planctomycetaceae bacterium]|nr:GNAT family N-acetyltransferase [Planctomycetaceae bacterium]
MFSPVKILSLAVDQLKGGRPAFLFDVAERLHARGQLRLQWIELDGAQLAVDFSVSGSQCVYGYQCGINPDYSKLRPGTLMMAANFQQAIRDGYREFDFLRGDEDYKTHWAADQKPSRRIRVVPPGAVARTKHGLWLTGATIKHWMKASRHRVRLLRTAGM